MTKSHWVACYFWNNYIFPYTALGSVNFHSSLLWQRQRESRREGGTVDVWTGEPVASWDPQGRWRLNVQRGTNDTTDHAFPCEQLRYILCLAVAGTAFLHQAVYIYPWGSISTEWGFQVPSTPSLSLPLFVYDPGWPYFLKKNNPTTQKTPNTFPSSLLYILSTRLILVHRACQLTFIEAFALQLPHIGEWQFILTSRVYLQQWMTYTYFLIAWRPLFILLTFPPLSHF